MKSSKVKPDEMSPVDVFIINGDDKYYKLSTAIKKGCLETNEIFYPMSLSTSSSSFDELEYTDEEKRILAFLCGIVLAYAKEVIGKTDILRYSLRFFISHNK